MGGTANEAMIAEGLERSKTILAALDGLATGGAFLSARLFPLPTCISAR
jgi:hypothetical protein